MGNNKYTALDLKHLKVQLKNVDAGKEEMEYRVLEREQDIERIKKNMAVSDAKIEELKAKIEEAEAFLSSPAANIPAPQKAG